MPYEGQIRQKLLNLVKGALDDTNYFKKGYLRSPESAPTGDLPAYYLTLNTETKTGLTNQEEDSDFRMTAILFVSDPEKIDLVKAEATDRAEEKILSLQLDANFTAIAHLIHIDTIDYQRTALEPLGLFLDIKEPRAVVRMDIRAEYSHQAIA
jgi:hypothetical protein